MKARTVIILALVPWMTVAAVSCRSGPGPMQAETPEATADFGLTPGPVQTELTGISEGFSPTPGPSQTESSEFAEDFGPTPGPLTFAPDILPTARVGEMYEARIRITENVTPVGEFSVSKGTLPAGLELVFLEGDDAAIISGMPEGAGASTFAVSVWCFGTQVSGQSGDKEYTLIVEG